MTPSNAGVRPFDFESYGVNLRITASGHDLVDWAEAIARKALINEVRPAADGVNFASVFELSIDREGRTCLTQDGENEGAEFDPSIIAKFLNTLVRVAVAEHATDRLFMHAGAVAWNGKGIIFPGTSFIGKSTLVAELVRRGCDYFSDDYAVFDLNGRLYPFPRQLSMRTDEVPYRAFEVTAEELGGRVGQGPLQIDVICLTGYDKAAEWAPKTLSAGQAALEMMPFTFSFVNRPEFSLSVLNKIVERATIVSGQRGAAEIFAESFLKFVDNIDV